MTKKILTLLFSVIILITPTYGQLSKTITVTTPGTLESQLGTDKAKVTDLVLTGTINSADFTTIKQMTLLKVLDMSNVDIIDGKIPASAFANRNMTKLILPIKLKIIGDNAFDRMSVFSLDFSACLDLEELGNKVFSGFKSSIGILDFSKNKSLTRFLKEGQNRWGTF
ncbi:leucine-rich repeat protein, partial [Dysgonomonas sp. HGC4]